MAYTVTPAATKKIGMRTRLSATVITIAQADSIIVQPHIIKTVARWLNPARIKR